MQPPSPTPSKNWWKDKATRRGLIVATFLEAPKSTPIITEWKTIPNSKTWQNKKANQSKKSYEIQLVRISKEWTWK
jgi:hypothetical protein